MKETQRALTRLCAACALALAAVLPDASTAQTQPAPLIRVGAGPDDPSIPLFYAAQAGLYAKAGLNVELVRLPGAAAVAAALAGGSLDIGKGATLTVVQAIAKGLPFRVIGSLGADTPETHGAIQFIVAADSPIKSPKDLSDKTIASISLSDESTLATRAWIDQNGGDSSSLKYVEVSASASLAALQAGRISGANLYEPQLTAALASGMVRSIGYPYDAIGKRWTHTVLFTNTSWADQHRDLVARFLRVTQDAGRYVAAHEREMNPLEAQFTTTADPALLAKITHVGREVSVNPSDLQPLLDAALKYKMIPTAITAQDVLCSCALEQR